MKALVRGPLFLLLSLLAACGTQLVEFPADGGKDATIADGRILDVAVGVETRDAADAAASDGVNSDAVNPDTRIPDGGLLDVGVIDAIQDGRDGGIPDLGDVGIPVVGDVGIPVVGDVGIPVVGDAGIPDVGDVGIPDVGDVGVPDAGDASGLAPIVVSTVPAVSPASNVSITTRPSATFNKPMDATTITDLTFTLRQGLVIVPGIVSYNALTMTATFTPTNPLAVNTTYTATVTTEAEDLAGNPLATDHIWIFTTAACSHAPIVLGSAANFVVLAGSTVTNTGPTIVTGDLGVSPGTAVTGFPPGTVVGTQHAMDPTSAQGILDLTTAYNNAAGRTLCPVSRIGDLGGLTLMPGLYKSTSDMSLTTADLTLDAQGDPTAVFIFQIASTLTTTPGRQVVLIGGARATNVFWQVGTSATLGSTTAFQGTIMADQAITLNTGATLTGRLLARIAAVSLDSNTVTSPAP